VAAIFPVDGVAMIASQAGITWPAVDVSASQLDRLPVLAIHVATNGTVPAIERARSVLETAYPGYGSPATLGEQHADATQQDLAYQQLADVVVLTSLAIAGCTLAVSAVTGVNDRRRPFSLLRLSGAPVTVLRRVVTLETAVPLLAGAAASIGTGLLASYLFLRSQLSETLRSPGVTFYAVLAAGLVASLAIVASTLPVLERVTGPEAARTD
jgi:hypothetical protein